MDVGPINKFLNIGVLQRCRYDKGYLEVRVTDKLQRTSSDLWVRVSPVNPVPPWPRGSKGTGELGLRAKRYSMQAAVVFWLVNLASTRVVWEFKKVWWSLREESFLPPLGGVCPGTGSLLEERSRHQSILLSIPFQTVCKSRPVPEFQGFWGLMRLVRAYIRL